MVNPHTFFKKNAPKITKVRKTFDLHADPKAKYFPHSFFSLYRTYKKERKKNERRKQETYEHGVGLDSHQASALHLEAPFLLPPSPQKKMKFSLLEKSNNLKSDQIYIKWNQHYSYKINIIKLIM